MQTWTWRRLVRWHHPLVICLITSSSLTPLGSCNNDRDQDMAPEDDFSPMSEKEAQALERIRYYIDAADGLDGDTRIPEAIRAELRLSVKETRDALAEFMARRKQGGARKSTMNGIGMAAAGILGNDATGLGVADDVLLIGLGLIALGASISMNAPASKDDLGKSWCNVGDKLDQLGTFVRAVGATIADTADDAMAPIEPGADLLDRLSREPANSNTTKPPGSSTTGKSPVPVPAPQPDTEPRDEDDVCKPSPWCPHKGEDTWHNHCADEILGNVYPTCDAMVNGKRFDALVGRTLFEVKTDNWATYKDVLKGWTLDAHANTAIHENRLARACGVEFVFVVADPELHQALSDKLEGKQIDVRHESRCSREHMPEHMR